MTPTAVSAAELLHEGRAAAIAGDTVAARARLRQATEIDPTNPDAWYALSSVLPVMSEKRECLQRALALAPERADVQSSLRYVEQMIASGVQVALPKREAVAAPPAPEATAAVAAPASEATVFCYRHPERETALYCVNCSQPICGACARTAAVGQLCPPCRSTRRPANYKAGLGHMVLGGLAALVLAAIGAPFANFVGFFFTIMIAGVAGEIVMRSTERLTRKRGRMMQIAVGIGFVLGALIGGGVISSIVFMMNMAPYLAEMAQEMPEGVDTSMALMPMLMAMFFNPVLLLYTVVGAATAIIRLK